MLAQLGLNASLKGLLQDLIFLTIMPYWINFKNKMPLNLIAIVSFTVVSWYLFSFLPNVDDL
ncbi:hypothetical protein AQF98_21665 [Pedobacter sp. Hv1]|nr:hypothetical protein AQF98_21665 [Pedobacter sp. Hv1]